MSWKGFSRGVVRAPQSVKQKFNLGDSTKDPVYLDAERRFQELETETKKLHDESKRYFDAINGMLVHQIEFSNAIAEIYKPISGYMSDPTSFKDEGNPEGVRACDEYKGIVSDLKATLAPELETIETRVIRPADELTEVIKAIRKTTLKRQHKQLDFDRHRTTQKKLQEKTIKDEKALCKAEADVELATQEFNYYNELLKTELPKLFTLEREFIQPLFLSFYYMQLNIFYTLHEKMQAINIGYFDLVSDIEGLFEKKRGDVQERVEAMAITKFKTQGHKMKPNAKFNKFGKVEEATAGRRPASMDSVRPALKETDIPPPPYCTATRPTGLLADTKIALSVPSGTGVARSNSTGSNWGAAAAAKKKPAPPPPKPKPKNLSVESEKATALYDFEAQANGDLSFSAGDIIDVVKRTSNANEWWTGKLHGKEGQFPGNYVKLN